MQLSIHLRIHGGKIKFAWEIIRKTRKLETVAMGMKFEPKKSEENLDQTDLFKEVKE